MYTSSPNVSCFSNKSPMISKKSKLCYARPWAQPQNLHIWPVLREQQDRPQDVAGLPRGLQPEGAGGMAGSSPGILHLEGPGRLGDGLLGKFEFSEDFQSQGMEAQGSPVGLAGSWAFSKLLE